MLLKKALHNWYCSKKTCTESLPCFAADLCGSIHKSWNQPKSATCAELALPAQEMAIYSPLTPDTPDPEAPPQAVDKPETSKHWPLRHSATRALFSKKLHGPKYIKIWLGNQCQNTWDQRWIKVDQIFREQLTVQVKYVPWGHCCHVQFVCRHSLYCHRCSRLAAPMGNCQDHLFQHVSTTPPTWLVGMCQDAPLLPNG